MLLFRRIVSAALLVTCVQSFTASPRRVVPSQTALGATIAVFGASGLLAQECVYQALENGDTVIGLTRCVIV
jgi:hypothetical protein